MRCPKCHYLSFEPESRCRNCGYDFSLSSDLPIRLTDEPLPLADFDLHVRGTRSSAPPAATLGPIRPSSSVAVAEPEVASPSRPRPVRRPVPAPLPTSELPLFVQGLTRARDEAEREEPVVTVPPAPPPLAVRRSTPRPEVSEHDLLPPPERPVKQTSEITASGDFAASPAMPAPDDANRPVRARDRLAAAGVDALLLAGIDIAVVWFTLRACELTLSQVGILPVVPLAAFFLLVDAGYLLLFTAAIGQTIGKMAAGIRVVGIQPAGQANAPVTFGQAALRALVAFPSILALGAGFLPGLFGEGRTLHDRIAQTRVVRA